MERLPGYSVESDSLYKAVGRDPYSSPIHGNARREWVRTAGTEVFPPPGGFAPENLVLRQMFYWWYDQPMVGSTGSSPV